MSNTLMGYYERETVRVTSEGELNILLDAVVALPHPTWLQLESPSHEVLMIGLGQDFSSLRFIEGLNAGDEMYHSVGTLADPAEAEFDMGSVPTKMDVGSAIPAAHARAAAAEFLRTSQRPASVAWTVVPMPEGEPDPVEGWGAFADPK
ncbi:Imm1 family immunity protein [Kribbella ginsengisoli]|uniref:Immunity protein Imm1 n=1 Tax=Kribbella ginsengisoli TaxID=363865 RepID=A0ABP6Z663_9ACTN